MAKGVEGVWCNASEFGLLASRKNGLGVGIWGFRSGRRGSDQALTPTKTQRGLTSMIVRTFVFVQYHVDDCALRYDTAAARKSEQKVQGLP